MNSCRGYIKKIESENKKMEKKMSQLKKRISKITADEVNTEFGLLLIKKELREIIEGKDENNIR